MGEKRSVIKERFSNGTRVHRGSDFYTVRMAIPDQAGFIVVVDDDGLYELWHQTDTRRADGIL